jgi:cyanophycin synthetase
VGVVLNVQDDHLGQHGAETLEDLARVKGLIARVARKAVVLNAQDPLVVALAETRQPGAELLYFSLDEADPVVARHLDAGGRAVYLRRNMIMLAHGDHRIPLIEVDRVPFTLAGRARFNVANAMASVAALWAGGWPTAQIAAGLRTFTSGVDQNPGRMNFFQIRDFQVIADYAHNPESYRLLLETARALPHRRIIGVIAAPGDRYDEKLREIGRICGAAVDHLIIREMAGDLRGRRTGETPALLADGAREAGLGEDRLQVIVDEPEAVETALAMAREGDLVVVGCADTPRLLAQLGRHAGGLAGGGSHGVSITLVDPGVVEDARP